MALYFRPWTGDNIGMNQTENLPSGLPQGWSPPTDLVSSLRHEIGHAVCPRCGDPSEVYVHRNGCLVCRILHAGDEPLFEEFMAIPKQGLLRPRIRQSQIERKEDDKQRAASMVEYALLLVLAALIAVAALSILGKNTSRAFSSVGNALTTQTTSGGSGATTTTSGNGNNNGNNGNN